VAAATPFLDAFTDIARRAHTGALSGHRRGIRTNLDARLTASPPQLCWRRL
jgi:hypothetical protein